MVHKCQDIDTAQAGEPEATGIMLELKIWSNLQQSKVLMCEMIQGLENAFFMTGPPGPHVKMAFSRGTGR